MSAPIIAAATGTLAGAVLALLAFLLPSSDEQADWLGRPLAVRVPVALACAIVSAVSAAGAVQLAPGEAAVFGVGAFAATGPGLGLIDVASRRIPFAATGLVAFVAFLGALGEPGAAISFVRLAVIVALIALVVSLLTRAGSGLGDIVYAAVAALTLAWAGWAVVVLCFAVVVVLVPVAMLVTRVVHGVWTLLPLGPFLVASWWLALLAATIGSAS